MSEQRFLVVRLSSLGDIVHTFPAVAGLRESLPNAEIVWLTHPRWKPLVESSSLATAIWAAETRSFASLREILGKIRGGAFDAAIDYQGLWKSAALSFFGRVPRRIGFSSETVREYGVPILYTDRVRCTQTHIADQNGELSQRAGAHQATGTVNLSLPMSEEAAFREHLRGLGVDRYVALSPGGGWRSKCWPPERFGSLCRKIRDSLGLRCLVNYGPGEESLAAAVLGASGDAAPLLYNGELGQLMALLRNAVCLVGGDTGPLHLAVALGTPTAALFGPTDPARNGPYRDDGKAGTASRIDMVLRSPHAITTYKRSGQVDPSMLEIEVDVVFEVVCRLVEARA
jgi:lipopolysaccharide heptosyltransferase I